MFKKKKQPQPNRTALPQNQAPVFSYYSSRSSGESTVRQPQATSAPKRSGRLEKLPSLIALLIIIGCAIYATSLSMQPKIQINSTNTDQLLRDNSYYQQAGAKVLKNSLLSRSKLTIDTTHVAKQLESQYPELGKVTVIIPLMSRRPIIEVQPAEPAFKLTTNNGSFILDKQGRALLPAADVTSVLRDSLPNVVDQSGLEVRSGRAVLPVVTVTFIQDVAAQLKAKNIAIQSITLPAIANELHLKIDGQPYFVKFDIQGQARQQVGAFIAAKENLEADHITPSEYIDVRVSEKVFYK